MDNKPLITVVTPSFNQADYISTCLNSVLNQTYGCLEHLVVDGGSTDQTLNILRDYKSRDDRLKFTSQPDEGQGDAVNKGLKEAKGEIIAWINSDDYYFDEEIFGYVANFFQNNPSIDILYGGMAYIDSNDELQHVRIPPKYNYKKLTRIAYIGNTNTFLRKKVVDRHLINQDYHYVIDHEYMLRVTKEFKASRTKRMLACFRVHPEAKTQTLSTKFKDSERLSRNKFHNIKTGLVFQCLTLFDRIIYKISLFYTDFLFLKKYQRLSPYKIFLGKNI